MGISEFNQSHDNWSTHLTHRLRVLLHAEPLLFDLRFGDAHCDSTLRHYDSLALALKLLDLIIETMGIEREIDSDTATRALTPWMISMDQAAGKEPDAVRHAAMVERLLGVLRNDAKSRDPFKIEYTDFEGNHAIKRTLEFNLIYDSWHPDGRIVLRLSDEAVNLFLNALKLDIQDAQAAAEAVVQSQLARGRFSEAVSSARDARLQSIRFQETIEKKLCATRRDVSKVDWQNEIPHLLMTALQHIDIRCTVEENIATSAREKLEHLTLGSEEAHKVAMIAQLIEDCYQRHVELHGRLIRARSVFLDEQARQSFTPYLTTGLPNFLTDVLEPLLQAKRVEAERILDTVFPIFFSARLPQTFSLTQMIDWQLQPRREIRLSEILLEPRDLLIIDSDRLRYPEEVREPSESYFELIEQPTNLSELLTRAIQTDEPEAVLEMIALIAFRLFAPDDGESLRLQAEKSEKEQFCIAHLFGDDLLLSRRNEQ